jgi:hypothetical protein
VLAIISSYVDRTPFAAATFLGVLSAGDNLVGAISEATFSGSRWFSLLALDSHPRYIRDWLFGSDLGSYPMEAAGFSPWMSVAIVSVVAVIGALWTYRRYRRLA